jgi:hypothetical protein
MEGTMNYRERFNAILHYEDYDTMPVIHFGFWDETLLKWANEGHLTNEEALGWADGNGHDFSITKKLGFDSTWMVGAGGEATIYPPFEEKIIEWLDDNKFKRLDQFGVILLDSKDNQSISSEVDHLLKTREDWEQHYLHRYTYNDERLKNARFNYYGQEGSFLQEGVNFLKQPQKREYPVAIYIGSLLGQIRNILGVENMSYLMVDDYDLLVEIVDTVGEMEFRLAKATLETGAKFDLAHYWEDICFKNGPLVNPAFFAEHVGPHYRRISDLLNSHGIDIISVDCDGKIDLLLPIWLENGVNTMFPIEVGTWDASIEPWRKQYGRALRGVGGMNKTCFSQDYAAIDREIERLKPLVDLGGYIPCPDHRIAPDAIWDNVRYYCDRMHTVFS